MASARVSIHAARIILRVTAAIRRPGAVLAGASAAQVAVSLVNFGLMIFGATDSAFGLRSEPSFIFGIPWGVIIGIFVVIMAAYSLVLDFDFIQQGVRNRAPKKYEWSGVFGIMVTVIWLYL